MQLVRDLHPKMQNAKRVIATIGNFDGVHLGHQAVLRKLLNKSNELKLPAMLITFEPSVKELFLKDKAPPRLTNFREKFCLIEDMGIGQFVCLRFNQAFASISAESFVEEILINYLHVGHLIVGDDFCFGKNRKGDFTLLQHLTHQLDFEVENTASYRINAKRVDSSAIRTFLAQGQLDAAKQLLGRRYSMSGRAISGDKKGRSIGFPTANIPIKRNKSPVHGVFAVKVKVENDIERPGVANVGHRPTVGGTRTQLETHIFDFSQDLYGKHLTISFCKKIRDEKKFDSLAMLKNQIQHDIKDAKDYFGAAV